MKDKMIKNNLKVEKKDKYELGFNILYAYFDSIPDEEKHIVDKKLNEIGL